MVACEAGADAPSPRAPADGCKDNQSRARDHLRILETRCYGSPGWRLRPGHLGAMKKMKPYGALPRGAFPGHGGIGGGSGHHGPGSHRAAVCTGTSGTGKAFRCPASLRSLTRCRRRFRALKHSRGPQKTLAGWPEGTRRLGRAALHEIRARPLKRRHVRSPGRIPPVLLTPVRSPLCQRGRHVIAPG